MAMRVVMTALIAALTMGFAFPGTAAEDNWIPLRDGLKARFLTAFENTDADKPRTLFANFVLSDTSVLADHARTIEIADQLFGRIVLVPADAKGFKRAVVNLLISETKTGATTKQTFEDFAYARGSNSVWLRQAGAQPWKTAQDAQWQQPQSETVVLSVGTVYVDFAGEIFAPPGSKKALGVELRSSTPVGNIPGKYTEIKELWGRLDHAKLTEQGFDFVHLENYSEPLLGKFQVRQRVYLDIRRPDVGDWPTLPDTAPLDGAKDPLVAGIGSSVEDDATRFASAAVGSIVTVSNRSDAAKGVTTGVGISSRGVPGKQRGPSAFDYLKSAQ